MHMLMQHKSKVPRRLQGLTACIYLVVCYACAVQVVQQKPIEAYRNTFANLALPLFAMAEPIPSKGFEYQGLKWSIWDRWILEGDLTVQVGGLGTHWRGGGS